MIWSTGRRATNRLSPDAKDRCIAGPVAAAEARPGMGGIASFPFAPRLLPEVRRIHDKGRSDRSKVIASQDPEPFPRLSPLVVRFGAMGDVVLLTPLLKQLHLRYGCPCVVMGSGGWLSPLLENNPDVSDVIVMRSRKRPYLLDRTQRKAVAKLRSLRTGPVYVCDDYAFDKIKWLLELAGISPERVVYANPDCLLGADEHWIDRWRRFGAMTPEAFAHSQAVSCLQ